MLLLISIPILFPPNPLYHPGWKAQGLLVLMLPVPGLSSWNNRLASQPSPWDVWLPSPPPCWSSEAHGLWHLSNTQHSGFSCWASCKYTKPLLSSNPHFTILATRKPWEKLLTLSWNQDLQCLWHTPDLQT
jgi:hypothetical protein